MKMESRSNPQLSAADLTAYLEPLDLSISAYSDRSTKDSYLAAAAVLAAISNPSDLKPFADNTSADTGGEADPARILASDLVSTSAERALGGKLMLSYPARRAALKKLGTRDRMLQALEVNQQERIGVVQEKLEQYIRGEARPLDQQDSEELDESLQAVLWLEDLGLPGVPTAAEARLAVSRAQFLRPFERIAGENFRGRRSEIDKLRNFVGVIDPEQLKGRAVKAGINLLGLKPKPAMSLYGPGGIGKTALVLRFCLEHLKLSDDQRVPFAYLDFDSPFLNINDPSTLAAEMVRQLAIQFPDFVVPEIPKDLPGIVIALSGAMQHLSMQAQQPYLIVLDTFEEVQYGGEDRASPFWYVLDQLQRSWPFLRILVSGRAPVQFFTLAGQKPEPFELSSLDEEAALAILQNAGVASKDTATALIKQVGRIPLSLQLAASVVQKEGYNSSGVRDLHTTSYLLFKVADEVIQGQLYERILGHIHDSEVVKLAHPGLVLRCITPDLILKVLKEPCHLSVNTPDEAQALYFKLASETALVSEEQNGQILRHPQYLRRAMLRLMMEKTSKSMDQIHQLAISYYSLANGAEAKAEELYHRLMIGAAPTPQEGGNMPTSVPTEFDSWLRSRDVRQSLSRSIAELPVAAQIFLAGYSYDVDKEILKQATQSEIEAHVVSKVEDLIRHGTTGAPPALNEIKTIKYRGADSPLYLAESRALMLMDRVTEALVLLEEGLTQASSNGNTVRVLELLATKCWLLERAKRWEELATAFPFLEDYARRLDRKLEQIQLWAQRLRIGQRQSNRLAVDDAAHHLVPLLHSVTIEELVSIGGLLRGIFEVAGLIDPVLLSRAEELKQWSKNSASETVDQMLAQWSYVPYLRLIPQLAA